MKTILGLICASLIAVGAALAETKTTDWCTIESPASAKVGEAIKVKIALKDIPEGQVLRADLHWRDKSGAYKGPNNWGGEGKPVTANSTVELTLKAKAKPDLGSVHVAVYLSPDGEFKNKTKNATGSEIKIVE